MLLLAIVALKRRLSCYSTDTDIITANPINQTRDYKYKPKNKYKASPAKYLKLTTRNVEHDIRSHQLDTRLANLPLKSFK